jgi:tetratricopeptide (TPR) repeat protein
LLRETGSPIDLDLAANYYERGEAFVEAAACWVELEHWGGAADCMRQAGDFAQAAVYWEQDEEWDEAIQDWRQGQRWDEVVRILLVLDRRIEAAQAWVEAEEYEKAGLLYAEIKDPALLEREIQCWEQIQRRDRLAPLYEQAGRFNQAAQAWESLDEPERAIDNWQQIESWHNMARLQEQLERYQEAIGNYRQPESDWGGIKRCARKSSPILWEVVVEACIQLDQYVEAAEGFIQLKQYSQAATYYDKANVHSKAGEQWEKAENYDKAKASWRRAQDWQAVLRVCKHQDTPETWIEAARMLETELRNPCEAAELFYQYEQKEDAYRCWGNCPRSSQIATAKESKGDWIIAADIWAACKQWESAGNVWIKAQKYCAAITAYEKAIQEDPPVYSPRPEELELPQRFRGGNIWTTVATAAGTIVVEAIAGPPGWIVGIIGGIAGVADVTLLYDERIKTYETRKQAIKDWDEHRIKQIKEHQNRLNSSIHNCYELCGCQRQCN